MNTIRAFTVSSCVALGACDTPPLNSVPHSDDAVVDAASAYDVALQDGFRGEDQLVRDVFKPLDRAEGVTFDAANSLDASVDTDHKIDRDSGDSLDVAPESAVGAFDSMVTSGVARPLGITLPCAVSDMEPYMGPDGRLNLLAICGGSGPQRLVHVSNVFATFSGASPMQRRFIDIPPTTSELKDLIKINDGTPSQAYGQWAVIAGNALYRVTPGQGSIQATFPPGHQDGVAGLFFGDRLYVATTFGLEGEVLGYTQMASGAFTLRSTVSDAGASHTHINLRAPVVAMEGTLPSSTYGEVRWALTMLSGALSLVGFNVSTDSPIGGRAYSGARPIAQTELSRTGDGRYVVFGTQDHRLYAVNVSGPPASLATPSIIPLANASGITDVRTHGGRSYASTNSGTVFVYSIPDGVLRETITTGSLSIRAVEIAPGNGIEPSRIIFALEGGALYAANL